MKLFYCLLSIIAGKIHPQNIWAIGALNQLFITGSYTQIKVSKNEVISGKSRSF